MSENLPPANSQIFNPSQLVGITGGRAELGRRILEEYRKSTPGILSSLEAAIASGDYAAASFAAHSLKGSSRTIGGVKLGDLCEFMEKHPSAEFLPQIVSGLNELMVIVEAEIRRATP